MDKDIDNVLDKIICANVVEGLDKIPDAVVALTWTSPPYNVNVNYDNSDDNLPYNDYLNWLEDVFQNVYRATVSGGRCAINIDAVTNRQQDKDQQYIRPIYVDLYNIMDKIGWKFRTEICWTKSQAVGKGSAWGTYCSPRNPIFRRNHEYILVWSKDNWTLESDEKSDLIPEEFHKWTLSHWDLPAETRKIADHPASFGEKMSTRIIKMLCFRKQIVLDPFSGSGTTPYVAYLLDRHYIGIDNSKKYCEFAKNRIEKATQIKKTEQLMLFEELKNIKTKRQIEKERLSNLEKFNQVDFDKE